MRTNMYCIYDIIAGEIFGGIIRAGNDEVARRSFHEALSNPDSPLTKNPRDYNLVQIALIDTATLAVMSPSGDQLNHLANIVATGAEWVEANKEAK